MKQYHDLLKLILEKGTFKPAARENMPGTVSYYGTQLRFNLKKGFPLVTTKKLFWKGIVAELLWVLRGENNIKFLHEHGAHFWDEDAYKFYKKTVEQMVKDNCGEPPLEILKEDIEQNKMRLYSLKEFSDIITHTSYDNLPKLYGYTLGDTGKQYPWLWRRLQNVPESVRSYWGYSRWKYSLNRYDYPVIDQFAILVRGLQENPMGRRHIIDSWNPETLDEMALHPCHALVQFNCRLLTVQERILRCPEIQKYALDTIDVDKFLDDSNIPKYYLDCQMYQRSADVVLGVPFNIGFYATLTHLLAKMLNMVPGDYIHTFGDVHIYENHLEAVKEQLERECRELPELDVLLSRTGNLGEFIDEKLEKYLNGRYSLEDFIQSLDIHDFRLRNYKPHPKLNSETKLSTGL